MSHMLSCSPKFYASMDQNAYRKYRLEYHDIVMAQLIERYLVASSPLANFRSPWPPRTTNVGRAQETPNTKLEELCRHMTAICLIFIRISIPLPILRTNTRQTIDESTHLPSGACLACLVIGPTPQLPPNRTRCLVTSRFTESKSRKQ